jgi:hypothetical protein
MHLDLHGPMRPVERSAAGGVSFDVVRLALVADECCFAAILRDGPKADEIA